MPQPLQKPWQSIVNDKQHKEIMTILEELEHVLGMECEDNYPGLAGGIAGRATFLGYLSRLSGKEELAKTSRDLISQAVERVGEVNGSDFYSGYSGIAWTVEHLQQQIFLPAGLEAEEDDGNSEVDDVILELLSVEKWESDYDLICGLVGYGVYALERHEKPSARKILQVVLKHLEDLAIRSSNEATWLTPPSLLPAWQVEVAPNGYYNLGLAHGIPGILLLLAAMKKIGVESIRSGKLLEDGMNWLLNQCQDPSIGSYLAGWKACGLDKDELEQSRVAWCYGDLGASLAIWQVGTMTGRPDWQEKALAMARLAAVRQMESAGVKDVGLCHGSAGNLVIFLRYYYNTGEACFLEVTKNYLEHAIKTRTPGGPFAGYTCYHPNLEDPNDQPFHPNGSLLEGAAGVGLALLAALGVEPSWDRFMMLSVNC